MRILFTTIGFREELRSFTDYVLARALVGRSHELVAYTPFRRGDPAEEILDGVLLRRIPRLNSYASFQLSKSYLGLWLYLFRLMCHDKPDVVHMFHLRSRCNYQVTKIAKLLGIPTVLSEWGILHNEYIVADRDRPLTSDHAYDGLIYRLSDCLIRDGRDRQACLANYYRHYTLFNVDRIVFFSEHNRKYALKVGIPAEKIYCLPAVIELDAREHDAAMSQRLAGFGRPLILFIGQLKYRKGFDLLVRAMPHVLQEHPDASFVFVSSYWKDNPNYDVLMESVRRRQLEEHFHFLGTVSEARKWTLLGQADALVMPSRYEGFGLPLLEAMIAGCAIVATDVAAINEIIQDGYNGLLFPLEDTRELAHSINRLLGDPGLRSTLADNGRRCVRGYDVNSHIEGFEALYCELMGTA